MEKDAQGELNERVATTPSAMFFSLPAADGKKSGGTAPGGHYGMV
jgi:hypothetical protein